MIQAEALGLMQQISFVVFGKLCQTFKDFGKLLETYKQDFTNLKNYQKFKSLYVTSKNVTDLYIISDVSETL